MYCNIALADSWKYYSDCYLCLTMCKLYQLEVGVIIFIISGRAGKLKGVLKEYKDCTEEIKSWTIPQKATIQFEYEEWPRYFMYPGTYPYKPHVAKFADPEAFDSRICWRLVDCGEGFVCIRNVHMRWRNYYLYSTGKKNSASSPILKRVPEEIPIPSSQYHFKLLCIHCRARENCQIKNRMNPYKFYPKGFPTKGWIYLEGKLVNLWNNQL